MRPFHFLHTALLLLLALPSFAAEPPLLERVYPEQVGLDSHAFIYADSVVFDAIERGQILGGVLAVVRHNKLAYLKAYGNRSLYPEVEPMTTETIFDLGTMTKPLSTGIATMLLLERGKLLLQDCVHRYLTEWSEDDTTTIGHLLTHTSGLPSYVPIAQVLQSEVGATPQEKLAHHIATVERHSTPGERRVYSSLNFITLQYIIEQVTGTPLSQFVQSEIYQPMGLHHTGYQPPQELLHLVAPTEVTPTGEVLRGVVHDPLARELNLGVSSNAGLFSSAEEVAALATMLLNRGTFRGRQILGPTTVEAFTTVPHGYEAFGFRLGWSHFLDGASNNGNLSSSSVFGHTSYTGTSISIDPERDLAIIFLSNRVHPADTTSSLRVNATLHNIITSAIRAEGYFDRFRSYYFQRWEAFQQEPPITEEDIVMLGNSITEGGKKWNDHFPKLQKRIVNRGISGDTTRGVLHRLDEIERQMPAKLFLLIGINDVSYDLTPKEIVANITYIIERLHQANPKTELYLQTLLPINESYLRHKALNGKTNQVPEINRLLKEIAQQYPYITLIDLYPHFTDHEDNLHHRFTYDGLHLNAAGYQVWAKTIAPYLQ